MGENKKEGPSKILSDIEFQSKREKGLCFKCDNKYHSGHKCKEREQRELRMFVVRPENTEEEIIEEDGYEQELNSIELREEVEAVVELSINSLVGLSNLSTLKVRRKIHGDVVVVLIDCRAMHNFISKKLVSQLKLHTKKSSNYGLHNPWVRCCYQREKGVCEKVEVMLNDWQVVEEFLQLGLGRSM
ncbi:ty3-gypsy retrotransposon protein [Cucumis melo var. makuwa]|uniref:Ty3-gypsy retrotransposon protein n=1 Tax=Cucumis melo var. makuwa TaxID=1194695 RepID=A0A5A7VIG5_CUCMM|nr:ty3-gypsy retrotransposon protein [Cucumis melo var. makuwa]TYK15191.1 ty3-gypsy retrotransposon protein [Cucumis melo var. makuwa]